MPILLSPTAYIEKNSLASTGVWGILLEVYVPQLNDYIRISSTNEDVIWRGNVWQPFPFEMDEIGDSSKGELTQFAIKICNINGILDGYVDQADGGVGSIIKIMVVNTNVIIASGEIDPEIELGFVVKATSINNSWVTFTLGATNPYSILIGNRMIRTGCRFVGENGTQNGFKGARCKYNGSITSCNKTLTMCRELGNSNNFGGFPGIGVGNTFYV